MAVTYLLIGAYLAAIVGANLLAATFGAWVTIPSAFVLIGLDLSTRDILHDIWHGRVTPMIALIATGSLLSYLLNASAGPIALASCVAFGAAALADYAVYRWLAPYRRLVRINGSNLVGGAVDSLLFPALAFGVLLPAVVIGQFLAKFVGGALWGWLLVVLDEHAHRQDSRADA
jgi:queuosine precursor transporter